MNNSENKLQEIVRRIKENKKQHRRIRLYMTILSCVVFLLVFWQLRGTGIALLRDSAGVATSTDAEKKEIHGEPEDIRESGTVTVEKNKENETGRNINDEKIDSKTSDKADDIFEDEKLNTKETSSEETEEASEEESEEPEKVEYESESESGIRVRISASTDAFPEGTDVRVEDVPEDMAMEIAEAGVAEIKGIDVAAVEDETETDETAEISTIGDAEAAEAETLEQEVEIHSAVGVDITFISPEGKEIEPVEGSSVDVSILLPEESEIDNDNLCLLHQVDEETIEHIEDAKVEDEEVVFTTESFSIYVMTNLGPKDKDKIHESLKGYDWFNDPDDPNAQYVRNLPERPYIMHIGDEITLIGVGTSDSMWSYCTEKYNSSIDNIITPGNTIVEDLGNGNKKLTKTYTAIDRGKVEIHYGNEVFYIEVKGDGDEGHHSDIEIEDGGYFNKTVVTYDNDGNEICTIISYQTRVVKVHESHIFNESNQEITHRESDLSKPSYFVEDDYEEYNNSGNGGQYEITSAWKGNDGTTPKYDLEDVDHVSFLIDLEFVPRIKTVFINGSKKTEENISSDSQYEKFSLANIEFLMNKQSVLDALNKCPAHNGMDFNIKYSRASCELRSKKELVGGKLEAGMFSFQVLDNQENVVVTAVNDEVGNIIFPQIEFSEPGTYRYKIREVYDQNQQSIVYDTSPDRNVAVEVVRDPDTQDLYIYSITYADGKIPEFTNYVKYTLPSTGGIGIYPYIILGIILCGASLLLLILTRRRGSG